MNKRHVIDTFVAWSSDAIDAAERERIETHLSGCRECAVYFERMNAFMQSMQASALPGLIADPHLPTRVRALAEEQARQGGVADVAPLASRSRGFAGWLRLSFAGALAALAITIGIYVGYGAGLSISPVVADLQLAGDESSDAFDLYYNVLSQSGFADNWSQWEGESQP